MSCHYFVLVFTVLLRIDDGLYPLFLHLSLAGLFNSYQSATAIIILLGEDAWLHDCFGLVFGLKFEALLVVVCLEDTFNDSIFGDVAEGA